MNTEKRIGNIIYVQQTNTIEVVVDEGVYNQRTREKWYKTNEDNFILKPHQLVFLNSIETVNTMHKMGAKMSDNTRILVDKLNK